MSPLFKSAATASDPPLATESRSQPGFEELLSQLGDDDPDVRRAAVLGIADNPLALTALAERVGVEHDHIVREALCSQLARHDVPEVVDIVIGHLASDNAALRNDVVELLARLPISTARRVPALLADPDPDVRLLAVMVLSGLRSPEVETWLSELVRHDLNANVVASAIGELVALAGKRSWATLIAARERFPDDPFIAFSVSRVVNVPDSERS